MSFGLARIVEPAAQRALVDEARALPRHRLTARQALDLELLADGSFAPLSGFLGEADYRNVVDAMRLSDGRLWALPVALDLPDALATSLAVGASLALVDEQSRLRAVLRVEEIFERDRRREAEGVFGTTSHDHSGVAYLLDQEHDRVVAGALRVLPPPPDRPLADWLLSPAATRAEIARHGWQRVVAFQTRNPAHRAHHALMTRAMEELDAALLLHPAVGETAPGDIAAATRMRCYRAFVNELPAGRSLLAALPIAMRMAGPREAVLHAQVRRNHGATHFVVGRDHAGPGSDRDGRPFYPPDAARQLAERHAAEIGIGIVGSAEVVWAPARRSFVERTALAAGEAVETLSGTELRRRLDRGEELPEWFTFPAVERELRHATRPRRERGFVLFLTGLSGAGKSTLARLLADRLALRDERSVRVLDGDVVRPVLSTGLGFSRADRDLNVRRVGFVAGEIARAGGIAICALIAPYASARRAARRDVVAAGGDFILVHVSTGIEVCEERDAKGLYAAAHAGEIAAFTGVSDPYEEPAAPEIVVDLGALDGPQAASSVLAWLEREGYLDTTPEAPDRD